MSTEHSIPWRRVVHSGKRGAAANIAQEAAVKTNCVTMLAALRAAWRALRNASTPITYTTLTMTRSLVLGRGGGWGLDTTCHHPVPGLPHRWVKAPTSQGRGAQGAQRCMRILIPNLKSTYQASGEWAILLSTPG